MSSLASRILFEDNHLIAINKPHGQPVQSDESGDFSLFDEVIAFIKERDHKPGNVFLGLVHRLDRPVGGVVLLAKTSKAASRLAEQFRTHTIEKVYWAIGEAHTPPYDESLEAIAKREGGDGGGQFALQHEGRIEQWLTKNEQTNVVTAHSRETTGAQYAHTAWKKKGSSLESGFLYELRPTTGRSHQLRVALAYGLHTPILGDLKYGAKTPLDSGHAIALFARSLAFDHPVSKERLVITAEPTLSIFRR